MMATLPRDRPEPSGADRFIRDKWRTDAERLGFERPVAERLAFVRWLSRERGELAVRHWERGERDG